VSEQPQTLTPLALVAAALHETYTALVQAGFTTDEALRLVGMIAVGLSKDEDGSTT